MATSAFRSTTKRTPVGKSSTSADDLSSSNRSSASRRSRSLSRFSRPIPAPDADGFSDETPAPKGRFVNTLRGSGFPEISLDDLAIELSDSFSSGGDDRGRASRKSDVSPCGSGGVSASQRRGRSVSRQGSKGSLGNSTGGGKVISDSGNSRRRRSTSVVRYQISDSESDLDRQNSSNRGNLKSSISENRQMPVSHNQVASNHRPGLRRSFSQKDMKYHDGYSSQSSALTDDEGKDIYSCKNGIERTIRTVYAQKKAEHPTGDDVNSGLYEAMRKELRHAVEEIRMQLEQTMGKSKNSVVMSDDCSQSNSSDVLPAVSTTRRNHATKLELSEKRKQDLLAEIVLEEQRGRELSKIVKELLPDPKNSVVVEKPARARKRSNDINRMSKCLTEEAEKYIEDFIFNVEDTDISSLDGERSDTSSTLGGIKAETFQSPAMSKSVPVEMDGVVLPWLEWETSNEASPLLCKNKMEQMATPKSKLWEVAKERTTAQDVSNNSTSNRGSWNPCASIGEDSGSKFGEPGSCQSQLLSSGTRRLQYDVDDYLNLQSTENFLYERWSQQQRINSCGLLLCNHMFF